MIYLDKQAVIINLTKNTDICVGIVLEDFNYSDIDFQGGPSFTEEGFNQEVARLTNDRERTEYARSRKTAYDNLNQLELISDDAINGTTTHADAILAIKAEFPKPV